MAKNLHRKKRKSGLIKSIVEEIAANMLTGEVINIEKSVVHYFDPKTLLSMLQAKGKFASIVQRACKLVEKEGKFAGSLGDGDFGIPKNQDQLFRLISSKYYQLAGRSASARNCVEWAQENKLLPDGIVQKKLTAYIPKQLIPSTKE